jgi:hypothetical protein
MREGSLGEICPKFARAVTISKENPNGTKVYSSRHERANAYGTSRSHSQNEMHGVIMQEPGYSTAFIYIYHK